MAARKVTPHGFHLLTHELLGQLKALVDIGDQTNGLVSSAQRLAEHKPLLGTAPPALQLTKRLLEAAGPAGLTGEVTAADAELASYHKALRAAVEGHVADEDAGAVRFSGEGTAT